MAEARIIVGRAPVHRTPEPDSPLDTHYHYGERVAVLDKTRRAVHCRSLDDGYEGYIAPRQLSTEPVEVTHFIGGLGAYIYRVPDLRAAPLDFLPRHSPVAVAEMGIVTRDTDYARLDPHGFLPASCLSPTPPRSPDLVAAAELYLGAPYLWGGRSLLGIDCSGLVQQAFRDLGIPVPRDTGDQRDAIGAAAEGEMQRGDLIYIPGHVMIYAGDGEILHASGIGMRVRRDTLAELVREGRLDPKEFVVRRP